MIALYRILRRGIEGDSLEIVIRDIHPGDMLQIVKATAMSDSIFMIVNLVTGKATVSAPTVELIEHAYNYTDAWFPKRGPEQMICEFPNVYGITLETFSTFPKLMINEGIARYAKRKAGL